MTRPQRRAVTVAGLITDTLVLLALGAAALAGAVPASRVIAPAVIFALGVTGGTYYLWTSRSRP